VSLEGRRARAEEIVPHAAVLRAVAHDFGLRSLAMRDDGTLVVHDDGPGYRATNGFSASASEVVGAYVHVITDDVPAAAGARPL
jgi:hypothetical protein